MTDTALLGSLREENGRGTVHMEDVYATDIHDLWSAVSDPARLSRWLVSIDGDPTNGKTFHGDFTSGWEGSMRVETCEAPHRIVVRSTDGETETVIEANLSEEGAKTRLIVEERGLPVPEYVAHGAGWQAHFEDLRAYLAGHELSSWIDRLRALKPSYEALADS